MEITFTQLGVIHTPFTETQGMPIQSARSDAAGTVELFPEYLDGLEGIEDFSHIYLVYAFHRAAQPDSLKVTPFLDNQTHGIFATRFPLRPNPLGFSVVHLLRREGPLLHFTGADMLDGTPLLDLKPYIPMFDHFVTTQNGWYDRRAYH